MTTAGYPRCNISGRPANTGAALFFAVLCYLYARSNHQYADN